MSATTKQMRMVGREEVRGRYRTISGFPAWVA
jgi:hypothetical protein